jgi:hypothetical protein
VGSAQFDFGLKVKIDILLADSAVRAVFGHELLKLSLPMNTAGLFGRSPGSSPGSAH